MAASGVKRRHPATPSIRELTALESVMEDDDNSDAEAEAGEGGHHGASSRQKVSSKGKIPGLQTGVRSGSAKKRKRILAIIAALIMMQLLIVQTRMMIVCWCQSCSSTDLVLQRLVNLNPLLALQVEASFLESTLLRSTNLSLPTLLVL